MTQTSSSLNTKVRLLGETIAATALNKYLDLPEGFIGGQIERVKVDLAGVLNLPSSWSGTMSAQMSNLRRQQMVFDRCIFEVSAQEGKATVQSADIVLPTTDGREIRLRRITEPTPEQKLLLRQLGISLPEHLQHHRECSVDSAIA